VGEALEALGNLLLPDPGARALSGRVLRRSLHRVTARVEVPSQGPWLLKVHAPRAGLDRWLSPFRRGRARAEWEAARHLGTLRLPVPEALAFGERRRFGFLGSSFYAARFLEGVGGLREALAAAAPTERLLLLARTASLVRALHDAGFDHRDLHAGNLLASPGPAKDARLVVTDLHRSRMGRRLGQGARARAAARWLHSLRPQLGEGERAAWLAAYGEAGPGFCARVARDEARIERRTRRSRAKRCFVESTRYTRDVGAGRGARARSLTRERLEEVLRAHDEALAREDDRVLKRGRKSLVTRHGDVVVKETVAADAFGRLRNRLGPGRHAAGYRSAHLLDVLGVGTARPRAFLVRDGRIYSLFEDLSGLERLDHAARRLFASDPLGAGRRLLEGAARWLGDLHARGIYHGDLKGVNLLLEAGAEFRVRLIDTDACAFFCIAHDPLQCRQRCSR